MATAYITEFEGLAHDIGSNQVQIAETGSLVAYQTVTTDAASSAFASNTYVIRVAGDAALLLEFGSAPDGTDAKVLLPSGVVEYFGVTPGEKVYCKAA